MSSIPDSFLRNQKFGLWNGQVSKALLAVARTENMRMSHVSSYPDTSIR
jgi:hypothetical protein